VLDYGAGNGRNAQFLREKGYRVYAYDPFMGNSRDGWTGVSKRLPREKSFDVGLSSYVLNVLPKYMEEIVRREIMKVSHKAYHVVRNQELVDSVQTAFKRDEEDIVNWYAYEFVDVYPEYKGRAMGSLSDEDFKKFVEFGVETKKGFQRLSNVEGARLLVLNDKYKIYQERKNSGFVGEATEEVDKYYRELAERAYKLLARFIERDLMPEFKSDAVSLQEYPKMGGYIIPGGVVGYEDMIIILATIGRRFGFAKKVAILNGKDIPGILVPILPKAYDLTDLDVKISGDVKRAFIHEFIHYLDFGRSGGGVFHNVVSSRDRVKYFNSPPEFNAYYQEGAQEFYDWFEAKVGGCE